MAPSSKRKRADRADEHADGADHTEMEGAPVAPLSECPFTVEYRTGLKKTGQGGVKAKKLKQAKHQHQQQQAKRQKGSSSGKAAVAGPPPKQELDQTLPEDLGTTVFTIKPKAKWDSLKKYRNFVVGTENFALQEYIFVNHDNIPHGIEIPNMDDTKFWVARVLEIRAVDEAHVYLRVYWLYWPDELPGGRQPYHGVKELVASNHMEIIDAMTVSGRANVKHWMELDEEEELPDLFWRQKFDYPTGTLMEVREHCKCHAYYNPDLLMFGCPHCKTWLHEECLIAGIKAKLHTRLLGPSSDPQPSSEPLPTAPEALPAALPAAAADATADDTLVPDAATTVTTTNADADATAAPAASTTTDTGPDPEKPALKTKGLRGIRKSLLSTALDVASSPASSSVIIAPPPPAPLTPGKKGKGKTPMGKKPTAKDIDQWFDITIKPNKGGATKAVVRDRRVPGQAGEWEEDVLCLLCEGVVA